MTPRILVAEDNPINAATVVAMLGKAGYDCTVAGDGRAAVEAVRKEPFDLVLMDSLLPEVDGLEATRQIRRLEADGQLAGRARLPIVALTASAPQDGPAEWRDTGLDEYLVKPVSSARLLEVIAHCLGRPAPIDLASPLRRLQGREDLLKKLAGEFLTGLEELLTRMRSALEERDGPALAFAAHKLKGQAATFEATAVIAAAAELESAAWQSDWAAVDNGLERLDRALPPLRDALRG